jgi:hypothetical protein
MVGGLKRWDSSAILSIRAEDESPPSLKLNVQFLQVCDTYLIIEFKKIQMDMNININMNTNIKFSSKINPSKSMNKKNVNQ